MTRQMTSAIPADRKRALRLAGALIGRRRGAGRLQAHRDAVATTRACRTIIACAIRSRSRKPTAPSIVFVGRGRGGLTATQRADVMGMAQTWLSEGTGGISIDMPVDTPNARAASESLREIQATLRRRRRAAARRSPSASIAPRIPAYGGDPADLSEDLGHRRPLRPVARRPRPVDQQQGLFREQALLQFRLRQSAQPCGDGRQSVRPRAAARGDRRLYAAAQRRLRQISQGHVTPRPTYPEADKAKLSDTGK